MFLLLLLCATTAGVSGQSCILGKVDLRPLAATTYTAKTNHTNVTTTPVETLSYSLSLCNPTASVLPSLETCVSSGALLIHRGSVCNASMSVWLGITPLTGGVIARLQTPAGDLGDAANVSLVCSLSGVSGQATLREPVTYEVVNITNTTTRRVYNLTLDSYNACPLDPLFCDATVLCADRAKTCKNNICADVSCLVLAPLTNESYTPADVVTRVTVTDCAGTPIPMLQPSDFEVSLDGMLGGSAEANVLVRQIPASTSTVVSTVLLDVSLSMSSLKDSATSFVRSTSISSAHFVGLYTFDGSADLRLLHSYSTDVASLTAAINTLQPGPDKQSTNVHGAYLLGVEEAARSSLYFGANYKDVASSIVLFTDGYDTAGRVSRSAALTRVAALRAKSSINAFAVATAANVDMAFLIDAVGASNVYVASSSTSLPFVDIARRLSLLSNNTYVVGVCTPYRNGRHSVTVQLNGTRYSNAPSTTWSYEAGGYGGGCNDTTLATHVPAAPSVFTVAVLNLTNTLESKNEAFFFRFMNPTPNTYAVTVKPDGSVLYVAQGLPCSVGKYCKIATVTAGGVYVPPTVGTFDFMVVPPSDGSTITAKVFSVTPTLPSSTTPGSRATPPPSPGPASIFTAAPTPVPRRNSYGALDEKGMQTIVIVLSIFMFILMLLVCWAFLNRACSEETEFHSRAIEEAFIPLGSVPKDVPMMTLPNPYRPGPHVASPEATFAVDSGNKRYSPLVTTPRNYMSPSVSQTYYR